jgi:hypothetical protein
MVQSTALSIFPFNGFTGGKGFTFFSLDLREPNVSSK